MDVALVTCLELPEPDVDEPLLVAAIEERGARCHVVAWDDPAVAWVSFSIAVIRSTWNYHHRLADFEAWVGQADAACELWNRGEMVLANVRKTYMRTLAGAGVPVVPTAWFAEGERPDLARLLADRGWERAVVKPAVSAGSFGTILATAADPGQGERHLHELLAERPMMVQPYMESVEGYGERSLVWIDGEVRHAIRKSRRLAGDEESVSREAVPVTDAELELARLAIAAAVAQGDRPGRDRMDDLLYARVDIAPDADGSPLLMELELVEPSLFLAQAPQTLAVLADAIVARA